MNNNNIKVFNFESKEVRTMTVDNEPWFVGKDVATILGYRDTWDALKKHVDNEDKLNRRFAGSGQEREMCVINESGLYSLILSSKLPAAKAFKRWVTSEVLPSLRQHGLYATPETAEKILNDPDFMIKALQTIKEERQKREELEIQNGIQAKQIGLLEPKATYHDMVLRSEDLVSVTEIAKDYGKSARWMNAFLSEHGIQFKRGNIWVLYQNYADQGFAQTFTSAYGNQDNPHISLSTKWTQKGRLFIYELMKNNGHLPVVEADRMPVNIKKVSAKASDRVKDVVTKNGRGRKMVLPDNWNEIVKAFKDKEITAEKAAEKAGMSRPSFYRWVSKAKCEA